MFSMCTCDYGILSDLCMLHDHVPVCSLHVSLGSNGREGCSMIYTLSRHVPVCSLHVSMGSHVREGNNMISIVVPLLNSLNFLEREFLKIRII